jgi:intracellular multiplication protein IcmL
MRNIDDALGHILSKDIYTRERYYFMMRAFMGSCAVNVVLAILIFVLYIRPPQHTYFLTDQEGRLTPIVPLLKPVDSLPVVSEWVLRSTVGAYSYDFANYKSQLGEAEANFTSGGWLGFEDSLKKSGDLQAVVDNKYVVSAVATGAPSLVNSGDVGGIYKWQFQIPMTLTYESAAQSSSKTVVATVTVDRVPETDNPRGLGIESIILQ